MLWNGEIALVTVTEAQNAVGEITETETSVTVPCDVGSVGRNEFYAAATAGFKPEIIFRIRTALYSGQEKVIFEGEEYGVIRVYTKDREISELVCRRGVK